MQEKILEVSHLHKEFRVSKKQKKIMHTDKNNRAIRDMGADYICTKGDADFSLAVPLSIIEISVPYQRTPQHAKSISGKLNKTTITDIYRRSIEEGLEHFGFPNNMLGAKYCKCAMLYLLMSEDEKTSMTKDVYPYVAGKFQTTVADVERNIRIAIEKVWSTQDVRKLRELYPYEWDGITGRPSNSEFIHNMIKMMLGSKP